MHGKPSSLLKLSSLLAFGKEYNHRGFFVQRFISLQKSHCMGSRWMTKKAKFFREFNSLRFVHYFSTKKEQSSKTPKIKLRNALLRWYFEVCSIMAENGCMKPKKINSVRILLLLIPQLTLKAMYSGDYQVFFLALRFDNNSTIFGWHQKSKDWQHFQIIWALFWFQKMREDLDQCFLEKCIFLKNKISNIEVKLF